MLGGIGQRIVHRIARAAERFTQLLKSRGILIIAIDVLEQSDEFSEGSFVDAAMLRQAVAHPIANLVDVPSGFRDADHRHVQGAVLDHLLQRRKYLLVRQVSAGAEEDQSIRRRRQLFSLHSRTPPTNAF